jgi:hypothetical protein
VTRLVAAEPANNSVVDLAPAEIQRHRAKGATQEAAQLVSSNAEFAEEAARIVTSQGSRPAARDEARSSCSAATMAVLDQVQSAA